MYHKEMQSLGENNAGLLTLTVVSVALTIPFLCYLRSIANSLHAIAKDKTR